MGFIRQRGEQLFGFNEVRTTTSGAVCPACGAGADKIVAGRCEECNAEVDTGHKRKRKHKRSKRSQFANAFNHAAADMGDERFE